MATPVALAVRELVMFVLLCLVGSAPASWLPRDLPAVTRAALVPLLGLAVAACLLVTAQAVLPGEVTGWLLLLPAALVSAALAVRRHRRAAGPTGKPLRRGELAGLAAIALVALAGYSAPLVVQGSLGPIAYQVYDAPNYAALIDGLEEHALADDVWGPPWDQTARIGEKFGAFSTQQVGFDAVAAAANGVFGWGAISSQSAYTIVLVAVGALALAGAVAGFGAGPLGWGLAGLLYLGPLAYQLFLDGSEAALAGLGLLAPLALLGARLLRRPDLVTAVLFALLAAGLHTVYPMFFPTFAVAAALCVGAWALRGLWRRQGRPVVSGRALLALAVVAAGTALLSPFAFQRSVRYWLSAATAARLEGLPEFDLPLPVLPSYVLQTREFYFLPHLSDVSVRQWIVGDLLPLGLVALAVFGLRRRPAALPLAVLVAVAASFALYSSFGEGCSYCVQRTLLPMGPALAALVALGVAALAARPRRWSRPLALGLAAMVALVVAHPASVVARRGVQGAAALPVDAVRVADALEDRPGGIFLEGFNATLAAPAEMPAVYHLLRETAPGRLSIPTETDDRAGLSYLFGVRPATPKEFDPGYRWVMTRLPAIDSGRRVVRRSGPYAVERRAGPLDATVVSGVLADMPRRDSAGVAHLQGPLSIWVSATSPVPAFVRLRVAGLPEARVDEPARARVRALGPGEHEICVAAPTTAPLRRLTVALRGVAPAYLPPPELSNRPSPAPGPVLRALRASSRPC